MHTYTYDAEYNLTNVDGGSTATYTYNALNQRVGVSNAHGTQEFTYDFAGRRLGTWTPGTTTETQGQIWWGNSPIAYRDSDGSTYFQQADWLGTQRILSNYAGAVSSTYTSRPWGDAYATTGKDDNLFHYAGLEQSENTGIEHATYRDYDSSLGRWMSPDSYTGSYDWTNPQSFNRFAYAGNAPNSSIDPLGLVRVYVPFPGGGGCYGDLDESSVSSNNWVDGSDGNDETVDTGTTFYVDTCDGGGSSLGSVGLIGFLPPGTLVVGGAPSKGPRSGYESLFCLGDAIQSNGLSLALDAVGLLPEGGAVAGAFSLWHGAAGVSNGIKNLQAVKFGAGIISTASSGSGGDLFGSATGVASIAVSLGKAAPIYGQVLSVVSLAGDAYKTLQDQSACVDSGKYD